MVTNLRHCCGSYVWAKLYYRGCAVVTNLRPCCGSYVWVRLDYVGNTKLSSDCETERKKLQLSKFAPREEAFGCTFEAARAVCTQSGRVS